VRQTRVYDTYITTAPVTLDAPSTLTLYDSNFDSVRSLSRRPARLVLIGSTDAERQRKRYREGQHLVAPTGPLRTTAMWPAAAREQIQSESRR
jgi:hypothetical protein